MIFEQSMASSMDCSSVTVKVFLQFDLNGCSIVFLFCLPNTTCVFNIFMFIYSY